MAHWTSWRRSPPFQGGETGSKPVCATNYYAPVAQWSRQGALNSKVVGSNPTRHTKIAPVAQLDRAPAYEAGG